METCVDHESLLVYGWIRVTLHIVYKYMDYLRDLEHAPYKQGGKQQFFLLLQTVSAAFKHVKW